MDYLDNYDQMAPKYKKLGMEIPARNLIKTAEDIEKIKKAAKVNIAVLDEVAKQIKEGMSTQDIDDIVYNLTKELGGVPAPLNYEGYPKSVCTSVNDVVCHGIPSKTQILKNGDIINVDCTTIVDGHYADASRMFIIGSTDDNAKKLVEVTKEATDLSIKMLKPYSHLRDIGYYIEKYCKEHGFTVVHEIGGHGVGNDFHEDPFVYSYGKKGTGMVLFPGMVFTIEPMVNEGSRRVFLDAEDEWTIYTDDGGRSAQWEYTILMTEEGPEIIAY